MCAADGSAGGQEAPRNHELESAATERFQGAIRTHGGSVQQGETRTRLLDLLLYASICGLMRPLVRFYLTWFGERVHPLRLALEALASMWAMWPLLILGSVFATRIAYPLDIEWCEGGILYQAYRLLHGLPVFVRDDPVWMPWSYPPAQTAVLALVGIVHLDFSTGRFVSVFFFALMCIGVFLVVYRHLGRSSYAIAIGLLTIAMIAVAYPVVGQWYDLIRVDSMMMGLVVIGILRTNTLDASWRRTAITAAILTASVYTKQTAVFFVAWCCMYATVRSPKLGFRLCVLTGAFAIAVLGLLQWGTDGTYWFWTVTDLKDQVVEDARLVDAIRQISKFAPFLGLVPLAFLLLLLRRSVSETTVLWVGSLVMALPVSLLPYAKIGGYLNNLMPTIVMLAVATALLGADLAKSRGWIGSGARWALLVSLVVFVSLRPLKRDSFVPTADDWRSARELNQLIASLPGGVAIPELTFLPARNGHENPHWYTMAMWNSEWSGHPMDMPLALEKSGVRWVFLHSKDGGIFATTVRQRGKLSQVLPTSTRVRMLTGAYIVLDELWEVPVAASSGNAS